MPIKQLKASLCCCGSRLMRATHFFGMVDDKDVGTVMEMLPKKAVYYFTKADNKRAINENDIMQLGSKLGLTASCYPDVKSAYEKAINDSGKDDFIFVGGSSYIVADFLSDCI